LKHHGDSRGRTRHRLTEVLHRACGGVIETGDHPQQCRLSRARSTEESDDLPRTQHEIHILQHHELIAVRLAEGLADTLHIEQRREIERGSNGIHDYLLRWSGASQLMRNLRSARAYSGRQNTRLSVTTNRLNTTVPSTVRWKSPALVASKI